MDQVSAQKMQESHVMAAYALRVDGVDLGLPRALHGLPRAGRRPYPEAHMPHPSPSHCA